MADEQPRDRLNRFLAILGALCIVIAAVGLFLSKSDALAGGFLIGGVFMCVASVVAPRMEGRQKVSLTGAEFTLGKLPEVMQKAEIEVTTTRLPEIEDLLDGR